MIPSFAPIHEYFRAARGATSPGSRLLVDSDTGLETFTIDQLANNAVNQAWRFIDGPHINYLDLVAVEETQAGLTGISPLTNGGGAIDWTGPGADAQNKPTRNAIPRTPSVAVIGAGMSGLLTALQLRKAGMAVTLYEAYGDPAGSTSTNVPGALTGRGHAGRVFPVNIDPNDDRRNYPATQSQLGCMRFPRKSPLFWWYLRACGAVTPGTMFPQFPNPAVVPSIITGFAPTTRPELGGTCSPVWKNSAIWTSATGPSPYQLPTVPYNYQDLNMRHLDAFLTYSPPTSDYTLGEIAGFLATTPQDPSAAADQVRLLNTFWDAALTDLYRISYQQFLIEKKFDPEEIERIGSVGLGTGGFFPLFGVAVLDIMRIVLWDYSDELSVPDLGTYPVKLTAAFVGAFQSTVGGTREPKYNTPVASVSWSPNSYTVIPDGAPSDAEIYDYVVLAMTHTAAQDLLTRSATSRPFAAQVPYTGRSLSSIGPELRTQNIMKSTKIFQLIEGPRVHGSAGEGWPAIVPPAGGDAPATEFDHRIRTLYGAFGSLDPAFYVPLGVTFLQPLLGLDPKTQSYVSDNFAKSKQLNALHYSWGYGADNTSDADLVRAMLATNASAQVSLKQSGCYRGVASYKHGKGNLGREILNATLMRFAGVDQTGLTTDAQTVTRYFATSRTAGQSADLVAIYWHDVPYVLGGFKLDAPGVGSHLTFAYKVLAESQPAPQIAPWWDAKVAASVDGPAFYSVSPAARGLFFAGDSFSNYGGWVEGAFQSALATSAGIIKQAHNDRWSGGRRDDSQACLDDRTGPNVLIFYNQDAIDALVTNARDPYSAVYNEGVPQ